MLYEWDLLAGRRRWCELECTPPPGLPAAPGPAPGRLWSGLPSVELVIEVRRLLSEGKEEELLEWSTAPESLRSWRTTCVKNIAGLVVDDEEGGTRVEGGRDI